MNLTPIPFLFAVLICVCGCQKGEINQPVNFTPLEHLNECEINIVDDKDEDRFLIINSQADLDQNVFFINSEPHSCAQLTEELTIDFDKWTLLIGKKQTTHIQGELIKQDVSRVGKDIEYNVTIRNGGYTAIGQFRFGIVIPKTPSNNKVNFNVVVVDNDS